MKSFIIKLPFLKGLRKNPPVVGMDVGKASLKAIKVSTGQQPLKIDQAWSIEASAGLTAETIGNAVAGSGMRNSPTAFAILDEQTEIHNLKLPKLPPKEMATAVEFEVKKMVGAEDFVERDVLYHESSEGTQVQCVVAPKDVVESRFRQAKTFGVSPAFLETESSALYSCAAFLRGGREMDRLAICDMGYSSFRLMFIHGGRVSFTRKLFFGLSNLMEMAQQQLNLEGADLLHQLQNLHKEEAGASKALVRFVEELLYSFCEEFKRSEYFAREERELEPVQELLLCGGGACLPYMKSYIERHMKDLKVGVLDPFQGVTKLPEGVEKEAGPLWACAVGLSIRESA